MNGDLSDLLREWPYEPGRLNVRLIQGKDGRPCVQVRLDLGIVQMECEGRPDGEQPHGFRSLLEYFESEIDEADPNDDQPVRLSVEDCRQLHEESMQYHHRYIAFLVLENFDAVVRDTTRNLRVIDLISERAESDSDRERFERFRPYLTMMRARALAGQAMRDEEPKAAMLAIDDALESLRQYFVKQGESTGFESSSEVEALQSIRQSLVPQLPVSQRSELVKRLADAVERENYELAAILQKELGMLKR
ncbi:MAG: hypothetical protein IID31_00870 [Planctomycetes bacterium]|nr:hypothetical protein [Planctomycetota bacterium]